MWRTYLCWLAFTGALMGVSSGQVDNLNVRPRSDGGDLVIDWQPIFPKWTGTPLAQRYQLYQSHNLTDWQALGDPLWISQKDDLKRLGVAIPQEEDPQSFYRLGTDYQFSYLDKTGSDVPHYGDQFDFFLNNLGEIGIDAFEQQFGSDARYLDQLSWDVSTAQFWDTFRNYPLNEPEMESMQRNGFVVTERYAEETFVDVFYNLWSEHIPVFISADAALQAWHRSYDSILEETEEIFLRPQLVAIVDDMRAAFPEIWSQHRNGPLAEGLQDIDFYLTVARSLLEVVEPMGFDPVNEVPEALPALLPEQQRKVDEWMAHIRANVGLVRGGLFGADSDEPFGADFDDRRAQILMDPFLTDSEKILLLLEIDNNPADLGADFDDLWAEILMNPFLTDSEKILLLLEIDNNPADLGTESRLTDTSQFQVRGHYENSLSLASYFRAVMWLGRIDFRMGGGFPEPGSLRQLAGAVSLSLLLDAADGLEQWQALEETVATFVGLTDSMNPAQMLALLDRENLRGFELFENADQLANLQATIVTGPYGKQEISSSAIETCDDEQSIVLPRSFTFLGQRFVPDSWVLSRAVYDRIFRDGKAVIRRVPSSLDVAFAALGNRQTVGLLADRMRDPSGMAFRDGLPYQHNLAAAYQTLNAQEPEFWQTNIYQHWLGALRALSPQTTHPMYPEAMRTEAWAMRTLNTQLASWTHLRHDTLLYAKQSITPPILCDYPAGYVEPRPEFWQAMASMAESSKAQFEKLPLSGSLEILHLDDFGLFPYVLNVKERQAVIVGHFDRFAKTMTRLGGLAERQLSGVGPSEEDTLFIKGLVEDVEEDYVGVRTYSGWYPSLYYQSAFSELNGDHPSDKWDPVIVDVHTDGASDCHGDRGGVLHEAVGNVNLMVLAIDHGDSRCVFGGPSLSYYEMFTPGLERMTDSEWKAQVAAEKEPAPPAWTNSYLAR